MSDRKSNRPLVIAAVMASMVMVATEATIVSTVMPQIVSELGGLRLYAWVFSAFLLTQTAMTVVFGKLADLYGRKPMMLIGIAVFMIGSVLAGFAWSMPSMIVFRLIQGIGAGAMQPVALTVVADLYPARERGKIQGYLASVWAISAVIGPLAGGVIIDYLSWAWVFWINVPIGVVAAILFVGFLHERIEHQARSIDVAGAALFTVGIAALMIALTEGGAGNDALALVAGVVFVASAVLFLGQERRAADPMISFALWRHRPIAAANGATVFSGMVLMGLTTFLPMYVQGVLHRSPVVAGLCLTMVVLGWPVGATIAARTFHIFGLRRMMVFGAALIPLGASTFVFLGPESSPVVAAAGSLVAGFGMGLVSVTSLVLIQEIVDWSQRGSATASNLFSRNLGSTLGATVLGAVLNWALDRSRAAGAVTSDQIRQVLEARPGTISTDEPVRVVLQHSLNLTFWAMLAIALGVVLLAALVPAVTAVRRREAPAE